jgi:hypothetical protein
MAQHPGYLPQVVQIVSDPGGEELAQRHRTELRVKARPLEVLRPQLK